MVRIKVILKAFAVIVMIPVLLIGGFLLVSPIAKISTGGLSHPLFAFPALILMIPWGILFAVFFFAGIQMQPSFVITSTGQGGYLLSSGKGRGGGIILSILKFVLTVPVALLIWAIVSIVSLFSAKMRDNIDELFDELIEKIKSWSKFAIIVFVCFPLIVLGFNWLENALYSPSSIEITVNDFSYESTEKLRSNIDYTYYYVDYYDFSYNINACGRDVEEIKGEWEIINKKTGDSIKIEGGLVPYDFHWRTADKNMSHKFRMNCSVDNDRKINLDNFKDLEFICHVKYISFKSNIFILGDFLFPKIDNEYEKGFPIKAMPSR